ncbi:MAG: D-glycero-beta-D-manno-heptose 1-phosphate adenylyltransferase [Candidatus Omnitrophota bacterium]
MINNKIKSLGALLKVIKKLKANNSAKIVFTNGCFDIMHLGHVSYLEKAKSYGDILIVGLNSDASVKKIKGPNRPIQNENSRLGVLAALESVDYITLFNEPTPIRLIEAIKPNILVKGADWNIKDIVGNNIVKNNKGKVIKIKFIKGYSTSKIIERIIRGYSKKNK